MLTAQWLGGQRLISAKDTRKVGFRDDRNKSRSVEMRELGTLIVSHVCCDGTAIAAVQIPSSEK